MEYPQNFIESYPTVADFAAAATIHRYAPKGKKLRRAAVYDWKRRNFVPHMWQPVVAAMRAEKQGYSLIAQNTRRAGD